MVSYVAVTRLDLGDFANYLTKYFSSDKHSR